MENSLKINKTTIVVKKGDITKENVDAIVNAANPYLQHGGGVAWAIVKDNPIIQKESDRLIMEIGRVEVGNAVYTTGGNLAKYVIHAVGPKWGEGDEERKLRNAIYNALKLATELKVKSIAIPAVSCGTYGFPKEKGTEIIINTIVDFLKNNKTTLELIKCVDIDDEVVEGFNKALNKVKMNFNG
ncbi:macro domain-containing protein [Methanotorris igneus]|uniref:Appr-1-p processing domain protein n=1 Tax=Methanotorris igneus (strain DSM 5666 / JCM 11834 / Kol 5) TaxID=880724 RepID=F6BCE5_METIK|nr:macro domain-containing protein [Methanotorris igneus]AEF96156.1 Appr-1-p processing domain protein [Methanotorris igneus Kol 5]